MEGGSIHRSEGELMTTEHVPRWKFVFEYNVWQENIIGNDSGGLSTLKQMNGDDF